MITKGRLAVFFVGLALSWTIGLVPSMALTIGGLVRQPLNLSTADLARLETATARSNEVIRGNQFRGAFTYRGVPLKTLLGLASVRKEESSFPKPLDLAVVLRNKEGKTAVLSWGEIFYRNPADMVIAFSSEPVMPHHMKNCADCHGAEVYQPALTQLTRKVGLPKLVVANDFFADRNLEDVIHIDIIELKPAAEKKRMKPPLFSPKLTVVNGAGKSVELSDLAGYHRTEVAVKDVSEGMGYHGVKQMSGAPLKEVLRKAGIGSDADTVILASSADNYRILISYGELFLNTGGDRILVADSAGGKPLKEGKFTIVFPDDIAYDRTARALAKIEVVPLKDRARLFVIGVGCADTSLITLQAVSSMGKADVFVASEDMKTRFSQYMGDKPVLFDPFRNGQGLFKKDKPPLPATTEKESLASERAKNNRQIEDALKAGKNVAVLEYGDPTIYPPWRHWMNDGLKDRVEVIPGLSAFNVANAMIRKDLTCTGGSMVLTTPRAMAQNADMVKAVAARGDTVAVFMGLKGLKSLAPLLLQHYPPSIPLIIAYKAGYSNSERLVKTTLGDAIATAAGDKETHLAMIYIGPCLK
jgi:precorrin-4 methylase